MHDVDKALEYGLGRRFQSLAISAHIDRGSIHLNNGNFHQALRDLSLAIRLSPDANHLTRLVAQRLQDHQEYLRDRGRISSAYASRGCVYKEMNQIELAIEDFDHAIEFDAQNALAYAHRGVIYIKLQDWTRALSDYNQFIALQPEDFLGYNNRGIVHFNQGNLESATADYQKSIELNPDNHYAYNGLAEVDFAHKNY
ncbi:MAG: tetratricopeptide repeat protein [Anaerolineae bacterium]